MPRTSQPWALDPLRPSPLPLSILLTGSSGFLGTYLLPLLRQKYPRSTITAASLLNSRSPIRQESHFHPDHAVVTHHPLAKVIEVPLDVTDQQAVTELVQKTDPDLVFHLAAIVVEGQKLFYPTPEQQKLMYDVNVGGTRNVLGALESLGDAARQGENSPGEERKKRALVFSSSVAGVMLNPGKDYILIDESQKPEGSTHYGMSKAQGEKLVLKANSPTLYTTALRISPILGPGDTLAVPHIHGMVSQGLSYFRLGPGLNTWNFTAIQDIADALALAGENLVENIFHPEQFRSYPASYTPSRNSSPGFELIDASSPAVGDSKAKVGRLAAAGEVMYVNDPDPTNWWDLLYYIWHLSGHDPRFVIAISTILAWFFGLLTEMAWYIGLTANRNISRISAGETMATRDSRPDKAMAILGWWPRLGIVEGVRQDVAWWLEEVEWMRSQDQAPVQKKVPFL